MRSAPKQRGRRQEGGFISWGGFCSPDGKPKSGSFSSFESSILRSFRTFFGQWIRGRIEGKFAGECAADLWTFVARMRGLLFEAELLEERERSEESGSMVMH